MFFFFNFNPYIAIIGDIKNSRELNNRKDVQDKLELVLDSVNCKYESSITAKFMITLGDEFQGLLCRGSVVLDIIEEIQSKMYPVQIRFGIGIGQITTRINAEMAIGADGPGYYKAREAIEQLKRSEQKSKTSSSDVRIEVEADEHSISGLLNTIFTLMSVIKNNWSKRQREIMWEFEKSGENQIECAEKLNVSQSTVQRSLVSSNYYAYKNAKKSVNTVLEEIGEVRV